MQYVKLLVAPFLRVNRLGKESSSETSEICQIYFAPKTRIKPINHVDERTCKHLRGLFIAPDV